MNEKTRQCCGELLRFGAHCIKKLQVRARKGPSEGHPGLLRTHESRESAFGRDGNEEHIWTEKGQLREYQRLRKEQVEHFSEVEISFNSVRVIDPLVKVPN